MAKRQVFFSFHYKNDVMRTAQVRNIGAIDGKSLFSDNKWEEVKSKGDRAIQNWIDEQMKYRSCLVVLVGEETANRKWINYEIKKAWSSGKGVVGIYIHNLKDPRYGKSKQGRNPFDYISLKNGNKLSSIVKCYNPNTYDTYNNIKDNIEDCIEEAIQIRNKYK